MVNYIVGGAIIGAVIYIIVKNIKKTISNEGCSCDSCSSCKGSCHYTTKNDI